MMQAHFGATYNGPIWGGPERKYINEGFGTRSTKVHDFRLTADEAEAFKNLLGIKFDDSPQLSDKGQPFVRLYVSQSGRGKIKVEYGQVESDGLRSIPVDELQLTPDACFALKRLVNDDVASLNPFMQTSYDKALPAINLALDSVTDEYSIEEKLASLYKPQTADTASALRNLWLVLFEGNNLTEATIKTLEKAGLFFDYQDYKALRPLERPMRDLFKMERGKIVLK